MTDEVGTTTPALDEITDENGGIMPAPLDESVQVPDAHSPSADEPIEPVAFVIEPRVRPIEERI